MTCKLRNPDWRLCRRTEPVNRGSALVSGVEWLRFYVAGPHHGWWVWDGCVSASDCSVTHLTGIPVGTGLQLYATVVGICWWCYGWFLHSVAQGDVCPAPQFHSLWSTNEVWVLQSLMPGSMPGSTCRLPVPIADSQCWQGGCKVCI